MKYFYYLLLMIVFILSFTTNKEKAERIENPVNSSYNFKYLSDKEIKIRNFTRAEVYDKLFENFYHIVKDYAYSYEISDTVLTYCIMTIAISESSTKYGNPFKNKLFLELNNPFGIKAGKSKGKEFKTVEYLENRTIVLDKFKYFNNLAEAIDYLCRLLEKERYNGLHKVKSKKEFFIELENSGYYTAPEYWKILNMIYENNVTK